MQPGVVHDEQEQLGTDECMAVDGNDGIVIDGQHFQFPHKTKVVMFQLGYDVTAETERTEVSKQSQRLERNTSELIVAEIQRLKAVLQTPKRQKVQFLNTVIAQQQTFYLDAEKIAYENLKHTSNIRKANIGITMRCKCERKMRINYATHN